MTDPRQVLRVGTRGSALAMVQTERVCSTLRRHHPDLTVEVRQISTRGDRVTDRPLAMLGRNGVFVAEIEQALRDGAIDVAVHSAKDLPSRLTPDMRLAALLEREDPRDVLVSRLGGLAQLPAGARVGTSSPRRASQLRAVRPDLQLLDVRGNVDTRLRKLAAADYDALVLAAAGLGRLGRAGEITEWLDPDLMLPSPGQGALALECRADRADVARLVGTLDHGDTRAAVSAERAFLARLGADCSAVAAAFGVIADGQLELRGLIGAADGRAVRGAVRAAPGDAEAGARLAERLLAEGGATLLTDSVAAHANG